MPFKQLVILLPIFLLGMLTSCKDKNNPILSDRNFEEGKWLLVVENNVEKTLFVIADQRVLKSNPNGLKLGANAYCGGTTCDGFISLFKDGKLVDTQEFLGMSDLLETEEIKKAYKVATTECIKPEEEVFRQTWDSLQAIKNVYPTRRHIQPEDKDIICFYKY